MIQLNQIARKFLGGDERHPAMSKYHLDGDFVIATNAHVLLKAPKELFDLTDIGPVDNYPLWRAVMPTYSTEVLGSIPISDFTDKYKLYSKPVYNSKECKECDGEGSKECDLGHYHDCEACDGDGEVYTKEIIGEKLPAYKYRVVVGGADFNCDNIKIICDMLSELGHKTIDFCHIVPARACVICVPDSQIIIVLMSILKDEANSEEKWIY